MSLDSLSKIHKTSLPRRPVLGIRTLGWKRWKPKAIEKSASSTNLSAKAVNGHKSIKSSPSGKGAKCNPKLVQRAEDYCWGSLWNRRGGDSVIKLGSWPPKRPRWTERVNESKLERKLRCRIALNTDALGNREIEKKTAKEQGLEMTLPRGQPKEDLPTLQIGSCPEWPCCLWLNDLRHAVCSRSSMACRFDLFSNAIALDLRLFTLARFGQADCTRFDSSCFAGLVQPIPRSTSHHQSPPSRVVNKRF